MTAASTDDLWTLLSRVGLSPTGGRFDALADPAASDALASLLAERLLPLEIDLVVAWEGPNSVVLGYAIGVRLGIPVLVLSDDEGLVGAATPARSGARAALVAPLTPDASIARMAAGYLESRSIALAATATLLARSGDVQPGHAGPVIALAEHPPEAPASGDLPRPPSDQIAPVELRQAPRQDRS
jgi:hypothetical protein